MKRIKEIYIITVVMLIVGVTSSFAASGKVNTEGTRMRDGDSTDAEIITEFSKDDTVEIIEKIGDWYKIKYNGKEGYTYAIYIDKIEGTDENSAKPKPAVNEKNTDVKKEKYPKKVVTNNKVKLYILPSIISNQVLEIKKDSTLVVNKRVNDWLYVSYKNDTGWIRNYNVKDAKKADKTPATVETESASITTGYVNTSDVNIRKEANTSSEVIATADINTVVNIIGETGEWYKIKYNGETAYIAKRLVSENKITVTSRSGERTAKPKKNVKTTSNSQTKITTKKTSSSSAEGKEIIAYAKQFLGYRYVYGGASPSGFDCSGFVYYVYNHFGYKLSRGAASQSYNGTRVSKSNLQAGDLVFFNNGSGGGIGHVGIYLGGGQFIHAANSRRGVVTDTINSGYYYTYYYTAARIVN